MSSLDPNGASKLATSTIDTKPSFAKRTVVYMTALAATSSSLLTGCGPIQTPSATNTLAGPSPVVSGPVTPVDTISNTETPTPAETDTGPAGDKPTTQDEFERLVSARGYTIDNSTQVIWGGTPTPLPQTVAFWQGEADTHCNGVPFQIDYTYRLPGDPQNPNGAVAWGVDALDGSRLPLVSTSLPDCSTLA